jgi:uncharacterized protein YndB with AHSA1/START domain
LAAVRRVSAAIEIAAPLQRVWDVLMDVSRLGEWVSMHDQLRATPELPLHDNATLDQTLSLRGRTFDVHWRLLEAHEPHLAVWEGEGPASSEASVSYRLAATGTGTTRLEYVNDFHLPRRPQQWLARRLLRGDIAQRETNETLQRLKQLIERETPAPIAPGRVDGPHER